jgi:hypothetical protein
MTLEELQDIIEKDLTIDKIALDIESLKTPQLYNKYMKHLNNFKLLKKKAFSDYDTLRRDRWEYYTGKSDPDVYKLEPFNLKILKPDVEKYLDADPKLQKASDKCEYLTVVCDYLEKTIKQISSRSFDIKNAIEWQKFTSGAI